MKILRYIPNSIVDGIGIRQVFYLAGCPHHCLECHNLESWNINNGTEWTINDVVDTALKSRYPVTFSGGDPIYQARELKTVCEQIFPVKNIWVYTGYTWDELLENDNLKDILQYIDVLVDGRFDVNKKDSRLQFRGSSNQDIIDCKESLKNGRKCLWRKGNYV